MSHTISSASSWGFLFFAFAVVCTLPRALEFEAPSRLLNAVKVDASPAFTTTEKPYSYLAAWKTKKARHSVKMQRLRNVLEIKGEIYSSKSKM